MIDNNQYLLVKKATIFSPKSSWHKKQADILISPQGIVETIDNEISKDDAETIDADGFYAMPSFVDVGAICGEPGNELAETYQSLSMAARYGGYGSVSILSNAKNPYEQGSDVKNVALEGELNGVNLQAIGRISTTSNPDQLAEIFDMSQYGVHLFSDGYHQDRSLSFLIKALQYTKSLGVRLMFVPGYQGINGHAEVNESKLSASLGMTGIPKVIEIDEVSKIINAVRYTGSSALIHMVSCGESVELIAQAKAEGLDIHASVCSLHLRYTEEAIKDFNPNFKIFPPLREEEDRNALINGLQAGHIDGVVSGHLPVQKEDKDMPFADAPFGSINIQTSFHALLEAIPSLTYDELYAWKVSHFGKYSKVSDEVLEGEMASFNLVSLKENTALDISDLKSLSLNSIIQSGRRSGCIKFNIHQNKFFFKN